MGLRPFFLPLFTQVRGIGILRSSHKRNSQKLNFRFTEFLEVPQSPNYVL
jgi:hypothetical protein